MSETYKKTLTTDEYLSVYKLGEYFDGNETARFVASKINERISEAIRTKSTQTPAVDDKNNPILDEAGKQKIKITPPEKIDLILTRSELDGFFLGVKETLKKPEVKSGDINLIGATCRSLGMSLRFEKYAESVISSIELNTEPLDDEQITDPLD
jgi:hypothetical protein